jgi:hypothetical protein
VDDHFPLLPDLTVGKWMLRPDLQPADWIGRRYNNRSLREPINVLIFLPEGNEIQALLDRFAKGGYAHRWGHSAGYFGSIGQQRYPQAPSEGKRCFSDRLFLFTNNHGRCFGPHSFMGSAVFTGAFSRESAIRHDYVSFNEARDDLGQKVSANSDLELLGSADMNNRLDGDPFTGDHDGKAILLVSSAVPAQLRQTLQELVAREAAPLPP